MYTYLKKYQYYEELYDRLTVEDSRRNQSHYDKFLTEITAKLPEGDNLEMPRNAVIANAFYMQIVGLDLLDRYENRDQRITEWMARDEAKDVQLTSSRLVGEPVCQHCGERGLRITDKSLMHRGENRHHDNAEEVLFTLRCPLCGKNSAFWEDGEVWIVKPTICPKCNTEMTHMTSTSKHTLTFIYTCPACRYGYTEKMDLREKIEAPDTGYDKDRAHYCLHGEAFRHHLFEIRRDFIEMAEFSKKLKEKEDNKHIYDAVREMKKPKIAEIAPILQPALTKAGYIEFSLDKPEIGKDVFVGFNCLDAKSDRSDYDSRKGLEKLIKRELKDTNWRLMSDGISYRLGYLNGRIRAYEREEDIRELVIKSRKLKENKPKRRKMAEAIETPKYLQGPNGERIIL